MNVHGFQLVGGYTILPSDSLEWEWV